MLEKKADLVSQDVNVVSNISGGSSIMFLLFFTVLLLLCVLKLYLSL